MQWHCHSGVVLDSVNGFDVIECERCCFKHIVPVPTVEELERVYREDYYEREKPLYLQRYQEDLEWWNLVYQDRYDTLERFLPASSRRLLDVGSGPGYFLLHGQKRGWLVVGVEPSRHAVVHSRRLGVDVREGFLTEDMADELGHFDAIHLSEVLEHLPDPKGMVLVLSRMLNPGGLLSITVPNDYNPLQQILRTEHSFAPWWVAPPHHINYFSVESLQRLVHHAGLAVVHKTATFPMEIFLLMGENYVGNDGLGRAVHGLRKTFELNINKGQPKRILQDWYEQLARQGIGRECTIVATRGDG